MQFAGFASVLVFISLEYSPNYPDFDTLRIQKFCSEFEGKFGSPLSVILLCNFINGARSPSLGACNSHTKPMLQLGRIQDLTKGVRINARRRR